MKLSKLNGLNVITADAFALGEVDGAHADIETWQITHFDVNLTKEAAREFGLKKPYIGSVSVCLPVNVVKQVGDVVTLNKALSEMKNLRECRFE